MLHFLHFAASTVTYDLAKPVSMWPGERFGIFKGQRSKITPSFRRELGSNHKLEGRLLKHPEISCHVTGSKAKFRALGRVWAFGKWAGVRKIDF